MIRRALPAVVVLVLAGCGAGRGDPAPAIELTADLSTPVDIDLRWTGEEPQTAAQTVEFATEPGGRWTIVEFLPARQRTYRHPDLIPQTPFYYRIRPVQGPATPPVEVHLAAAPFDVPAPADLNWAAPRTRPDPAARPTPGGAPANLTAKPATHDAVLFTWTDNATDEEGYLIEVKPQGAADWQVAMVLDANVNSAGLMALETERTSSFRVRAYHYGTPSNTAHRTTGGTLDE
jgi:hypothetical protein